MNSSVHEDTTGKRGMALVVCMLIMMVMALIATAVTTNSTVEIKISGNQRNKTISFNNADVGTSITPEIIEQNLENSSWDSSDSNWAGAEAAYLFLSTDNNGDGTDDLQILVKEGVSASGKISFASISTTLNDVIMIRSKIDSLGNNLTNWKTITSVNVTKSGGLTAGNAVQMAAGYEGKGKSSGGGGYQAFYLCESKGFAGNRTITTNELYYRHVP